MSKNLLKAIEGLRSSSAKLNKLTDESGKVIKQVEDFLNTECQSGVEAYVTVSSYTDGDEQYQRNVEHYLGYCRIGQRYRIAVCWVVDGESEDNKAWSDCSRDVKIESLTKLPELISEISKQLAAKIAAAEKSLATASIVADALVGKAG